MSHKFSLPFPLKNEVKKNDKIDKRNLDRFQVRNEIGADVAKWIKAVDCESTMRGFNSRRSPIALLQIPKMQFSIFLVTYLLTATKNKTIAIFFPFPSSSSKRRITPRGCGFFSTNGSFPFTAPMGVVHRVHNYPSYYGAFT